MATVPQPAKTTQHADTTANETLAKMTLCVLLGADG